MNEHTYFEDLLPLYVAGQLDAAQRVEVERHLACCVDCRADLQLWMALSREVESSSRSAQAPRGLAERALARTRQPHPVVLAFRRSVQLLRAQAFLTRREMWPVSAAIMALGVIVALVSRHVEAVYFVAPLIAAASVAMLSGPAEDPAYELVLASPTSPWKVLLARLTVVSTYNLLLALAAGVALLSMIPPGLFGALVFGWLGPMAFLSVLALLLSLWIDTSNAMAISYMLWIAQYVPSQAVGLWMASPAWERVLLSYRKFWQTPSLLCLLALVLVCLALWSVDLPAARLSRQAS